MQFRSSLVVVAFGLLLATPSIAQKVNATPLKWNPYRDMGGSCVYGAKGEVIHAPEGTVCPDKQKKPATNTGTPDSPLVSLPPALRTEAEALLTDHNHIATELERLRRAIATERKKKALAEVDRVIEELTRHHDREDKFLRSIAPKELQN